MIYAGEDGHTGTCEASVRPNGHFESQPMSYSAPGQVMQVVPLEPTELRVEGGGSSPGSAAPEDSWRGLIGQAGTGIHGVVAHVTGLPPVVASFGGGWFALWYPVDEPLKYQLVGLDAAGNEVAQLQEQ